MSPGRRPSSTSSRSRCATSRASARRHGCVANAGEAELALESSSQPRVSVISSSTARVAGDGVGIEQPQRRRRAAGARPATSGANALAELGRERAVEHVEQLLARAEVAREPAHALAPEPRAALAEDRHVGVAEAVDRLELVADREQVVALERLAARRAGAGSCPGTRRP